MPSLAHVDITGPFSAFRASFVQLSQNTFIFMHITFKIQAIENVIQDIDTQLISCAVNITFEGNKSQ